MFHVLICCFCENMQSFPLLKQKLYRFFGDDVIKNTTKIKNLTKWRHAVGFSQKIQKMFHVLICWFCENMQSFSLFKQKLYRFFGDDVIKKTTKIKNPTTWRHDVGFSQKIQKMFHVLICCFWENMQWFPLFKQKLYRFFWWWRHQKYDKN